MYNNKLVSGRRYGMRYCLMLLPTRAPPARGGIHAISYVFFFAKYARVSSKAIERFERSDRRGKATKEIKQLAWA